MTYQPDDPRAVLERLGLPVKRNGGELISTCPFCRKPGHLYVNSGTGLWKCHRCGEVGNLYQLGVRLGQPARRPGIQPLGQALGAAPKRIPVERVDAMHRALLGDREALDYCLSARRWSEAVVKRVRVGLRTDSRGKVARLPLVA